MNVALGTAGGGEERAPNVYSGMVVRPLEPTDPEALADLDRLYARDHEVTEVVSRASVHYFSRSAHSFVAEAPLAAEGASEAGAMLGFVLAHPVWSGGGAVVRIERLTTSAADERGPEAAAALAAAVVKSAYDAGVYRLLASVPQSDSLGSAALATELFETEASVMFTRSLGSGYLSGSSAGGPVETAAVETVAGEPVTEERRRSA